MFNACHSPRPPEAAPVLRLLLIDDHAPFREGLAPLLKGLAPQWQCHEAASADQALHWLARHGAANLALTDLAMPGLPGLVGLQRMREQWPHMPAVVLSSGDAPVTVLAALDAGAMGFVPKSASANTMLDALRVVLAHRVYVPPSVMGALGAHPQAQAAAAGAWGSLNRGPGPRRTSSTAPGPTGAAGGRTGAALFRRGTSAGHACSPAPGPGGCGTAAAQ